MAKMVKRIDMQPLPPLEPFERVISPPPEPEPVKAKAKKKTPEKKADSKVDVLLVPRCPACGTSKVASYKTLGNVEEDGSAVRYYKCKKCIDSETGKPTSWKQPVR